MSLALLSALLLLVREMPSSAYLLAFRGGHDLHIMHPDGTNVRRITEMPGSEMTPAWSPDSRWIAFVSYRTFIDADKDIYRIHPNGRNLERLTNSPLWDYYPSWSPDSKKIAYVSDAFLHQLYILALDKNSIVQVDEMIGVRDITWSPDGKWLVMLTGDSGRPYRLRPDGTEKRRLLDRSHHIITSSVTWSPDGAWLVYSENAGLQSRIYRIRPDGSQREVLTADNASHLMPVWSPDGRWIACIGLGGQQEIIKMQADGQNPKVLSPPFTWIERLAWSPDGQWIYFMGVPKRVAMPPQIFRVSTDGQKVEQLTQTSNELETPAISPVIDTEWQGWVLITIAFLIIAFTKIFKALSGKGKIEVSNRIESSVSP